MFGNSNGTGLFGNHVCGLFYNSNAQRMYLPQVQLTSHTTINPVCYTTQLRQTFRNPNHQVLPKAQYAFPLYDGVAVSAYTIRYADVLLKGVVKQKDVAKQTYQAAVDRGETAALLESLPAGIFGVTLGNVPANDDVVVEITYCGELKHDAAIDGLRYMLPTSIAPRYGEYPGQLLATNTTVKRGISVIVDLDMAASAIRKVQSPSHPIAVSMGAISTTGSGNDAPFQPSQASATLTLGNTEIGGDFILQLQVDDLSKPQAIMERHPTLPNQRAIMTTLVPKFQLESGHPEIVFIADQSGSMGGSKNTSLVSALKVFVKSLPFGVRFNICAFGNKFKFLWPQSQAYNEDSVNKAIAFVDSFSANYGGTEILQPITAAFQQRLKDMPMEVMLLTDGEVWGENELFAYINDQIRNKRVDARLFALGIGNDVSHSLVEGVARAGNGFAQFVTQNEDTDQKIIRMLRGALYAHTKDYEVEVHYAEEEESSSHDDDFEIVEKVTDCLKIDDGSSTTGSIKANLHQAISFFDTSAELKKAALDTRVADRYEHLPPIDTPKLLQAPITIPPLFPFNRSTVYLLLGPESTQKPVKSLTLRASSAQGPLELNIPIYLDTKSAGPGSIHHLAARKAIQDLEEGRGWLYDAKTSGDQSVKTKYASRFDELVERESVRLGERFQVAGKWTSFVAVQAGNEVEQEKDDGVNMATDDTAQQRSQPLSFSARSLGGGTRGGRSTTTYRMGISGAAPLRGGASSSPNLDRYVDPPTNAAFPGQAAAASALRRPTAGFRSTFATGLGSFGGFENTGAHAGGLFRSTGNGGDGLFGDSQAHTPPRGFGFEPRGSLFGGASHAPSTPGLFFDGPQQTGGGLLGSCQNMTGSLFRNSPNTAGGPFGRNSQRSSGLFGNSQPIANQSSGLFGSSNQTCFMPNDISGGRPSLFGANPFAPGGRLAMLPNQAGNGSMFGAPSQQLTQSQDLAHNYVHQLADPGASLSTGFGNSAAAAMETGDAASAALSEPDKNYLLTRESRSHSSTAPTVSVRVSDSTLAQYAAEMEAASAMPLSDDGDEDEDILMEAKSNLASITLANVLERGECMDFLASAPPPAPALKSHPPLAAATYIPGTASFGPGVGVPPAPSRSWMPFHASRKRKSVPASQPDASNSDPLHTIISLQSFNGAWSFSPSLNQALNVQSVTADETSAILGSTRDHPDVVATAMTIAFLEGEMAEKRGVWDMIVEKARAWLVGKVGSGEAVEGIVARARGVLNEQRRADF